jgi:hypothetical protein
MKAKTKFVPVSDGPRQAEVAKTNRLRALRLAKEAADKEAAALEAAAVAAAKAEPRKRARAR